MATIDTSGLQELQHKLAQLDGEHEVSTDDLMTDEFIRQHTNFISWDEMLKKSGVNSSDDILSESFSNFISQNTAFADFDEMATEAAGAYMLKQLGFNLMKK